MKCSALAIITKTARRRLLLLRDVKECRLYDRGMEKKKKSVDGLEDTTNSTLCFPSQITTYFITCIFMIVPLSHLNEATSPCSSTFLLIQWKEN